MTVVVKGIKNYPQINTKHNHVKKYMEKLQTKLLFNLALFIFCL